VPNSNDTQASNLPITPATDGTTLKGGASAEAGDVTRVKKAPADTVSADGTPVVAGYDLEREIARGGMGVVYAARDRAFGREVAVKVMLPGMSAAAFDREARITARLPHPGIPPVHALGTLPDGRPFLAMKLIRGDTLKVLLEGRADATADRARLLVAFEQMCQAVGYAHAQGIVHRDLKPANIMVGAFGEVQVMDWGLAKEIGGTEPEATVPDAGGALEDIAATVAGQIKGTPAYMAPEQARGAAVDARADVFALGGILAAILTGKPPFAGNSVLDTIIRAAQAELGDTFARLDASGVDAELVALCKRCLAAKADDRFANGTALTEAVAAYRAGVDARLRKAEQNRAAAEARAREEQNTRREAEARADAERREADAERAKGAEQKKRRRVQLVLAGVVVAVLAGAGIATALVIEKRAADKLAAEQKQTEERFAAEQERQAGLIAADKKARAEQRRTKADALIDEALMVSDTSAVPRLVTDLKEFAGLTGPKLRARAAEPIDTRAGLHARLALLGSEPARAAELAAYVPVCKPEELPVVAQFLKLHPAAVAPELWVVLDDAKATGAKRVRAAGALAAIAPEDERWAKLAPAVVDAATRATPAEFVTVLAALEPVRAQLVPVLLTRYPELRREIESGKLDVPGLVGAATAFDRSANLLARYAEKPEDLAELALLADPRHFELFAPALRAKRADVVPVLAAELAKKPPEKLAVDELDVALEAWGKRRGYAGAVLVALGEGARVWPLFAFPKDGDPTARSYLLERLAAVGADAGALIARYDAEADLSAKRALLVALVDFPLSVVPVAEREALTAKLLVQYREHTDPGLHGAIDWLLRQKWGKARELASIDAELAKVARAAVLAREFAGAAVPLAGPLLPAPAVAQGKDWFVNGEGQTFAVVRGPVEFAMGSPLSEPERVDNDEHLHAKRISRSFAIATKEVTVEQFLRFRPTHEWKRYSPGPDTPAVRMTWYDCVAYCNWLSAREGIPSDQWCYEPTAKGDYTDGMKIRPGHLKLTGYRLPTEAEWEFACRAGAVTARYHGRGEELLPRYGWFNKTSEDCARAVGRLRPNELGLFDGLGNANEWCEDPGFYYKTTQREDIGASKNAMIEERVPRLLRGGSFFSRPVYLRCADRKSFRPDMRDYSFGFRPLRTLP
jgi:formylglycine-generating enzyme required for sulfatase activity